MQGQSTSLFDQLRQKCKKAADKPVIICPNVSSCFFHSHVKLVGLILPVGVPPLQNDNISESAI